MGIHHTKKGELGTEGGSDNSLDLGRINNLLAEVMQENHRNRPDGFTLEEYAKEGNLSREGARTRLNKLIEAGKLTKVKWSGRGRVCNVYQFLEE